MDAKDRAARYLAQRSCSAEYMRQYLRRKGHEEEEIEEVVAQLSEYGFLDDLRYAVSYFEAGLEKRRGMDRIRRELRQKGVPADIIARAEEELEEVPDEREVAREVIVDLIAIAREEDLDYEAREKLRAKAARRLAGRGFSPSTVYSIVRQWI